jgi:hypothetical protein
MVRQPGWQPENTAFEVGGIVRLVWVTKIFYQVPSERRHSVDAFSLSSATVVRAVEHFI